ncbi:hypothetical protein VNI00_003504 [Paramarasmius palmivorus]|uniref:Beta-lactamase-related domain-containing protein n=1 Tax=Paramarasmius palmivorus TaxID=297713 RepID=A0AAW0DRB3_9AGAR
MRQFLVNVDAFIQGLLQEWGTPGGVSVAVGYGVAKLQDGTNFTADTRLSIGSNSKLFTIVSTGLLISNESVTPRISWDTKIGSVIPEWDLMDSYASEKASITDLMNHRTGLPRHDFMYRRNDTLQSMTFQYNNIMYAFLGHLPEALSTNATLARYVKEHVFSPLGLNATTYSFDVANASGQFADGVCRENLDTTAGLPGIGTLRALPYWFGEDSGEDGHFMAGAGGVISNANDMAVWLQTLLLWGKNPQTGEQVIPEAVLRKVASGVTVCDSAIVGPAASQSVMSPVVYGGGQLSGSYRGHVFIEHGGDVPGGHSRLTRLPFDNIGVAVLTNDDDFGLVFNDIIKYRLIDEALGLEPYDWNAVTFLGLGSAPHTNSPQLSNVSAPTFEFAELAGTYNNPGYGNWTFCIIAPNEEPPASCRELVTNATILLPGAINSSVPTLLARPNAVSFEYLRLTHHDGNKFDIAGIFSYPTDNPEQPFWARVLTVSGLVAEFANADDGIGIGLATNGGFWGAGSNVPDPTGDSVEQRAEVWFRQIQ